MDTKCGYPILILASFAVTPALVATPVSAAGADKGVDTSNWKCEYCPFETGATGDYNVGTTTVSEDSAYLGNATGYDQQGAYANIDAEGGHTGEKQQLRWNVEDLGLDSRSVTVDGGQAGRYRYNLDYSELPYRQFFTTSSVFSEVGNGEAALALPPDWVRAPTTAGFTALDGNLSDRDIASDRQTIGLGGRYALSEHLDIRTDYRQRNNEGINILGGSTYTNATLLPAPFDHSTDEFELGVRLGDARAYVDLSWYLSDFNNRYDALRWEQPFTTADGAEAGEMAQAPDNRFQQLRLAGGYNFSEWNTVLNLSAAIGEIEQDAAFLDYTTNLNLQPATLPRESLDGRVDTRNLVVSLNSRPLPKTRLRASYRYDDRDNETPVNLYSRVIVDTFLSGEQEANAPYSYQRSTLSLTADWDPISLLRLSGGVERRDHDRSLQEVESQKEISSYGRVRLRPGKSIEIDARYGNSRREIDNYDETLAILEGQNPLLRKYNLAYRFREYTDIRASWSPLELPVSLTFTGLFADDNYTQSQLGLTNGREESYSADFSWQIGENASLFLNAGVDNLESDQLGSEFFGEADWSATNDDRFTSWGGGFNIRGINDKLDIRASAVRSRGESRIAIQSAAASGPDRFPDLQTELDRLRLDLRYQYSEQLDLSLGAVYQRFQNADWALQGLAPDALPLLFSLGASPFDDENLIITLGVRYRIAVPIP